MSTYVRACSEKCTHSNAVRRACESVLFGTLPPRPSTNSPFATPTKSIFEWLSKCFWLSVCVRSVSTCRNHNSCCCCHCFWLWKDCLLAPFLPPCSTRLYCFHSPFSSFALHLFKFYYYYLFWKMFSFNCRSKHSHNLRLRTHFHPYLHPFATCGECDSANTYPLWQNIEIEIDRINAKELFVKKKRKQN